MAHKGDELPCQCSDCEYHIDTTTPYCPKCGAYNSDFDHLAFKRKHGVKLDEVRNKRCKDIFHLSVSEIVEISGTEVNFCCYCGRSAEAIRAESKQVIQ